MPRIFLFLFASLAFGLSSAQTQYISLPDPKHPEQKMMMGQLSPHLLENDTSFAWYNNNRSGYQPADSILSALEASKAEVHFVVFAGTWCEDSQFIIPRFFKMLALAGIGEDRFVFFAVNREKKALGSIAEAFNIRNVPTLILMKEGKEIGRVVEYGKTGRWDEELAALLK